MTRNAFPKRAAISLVEVLIVIAIIGILLQLILPAIEASREAARRTACQNNLYQIALGVQQHELAHGHYPTGGWGWQWVGDPDRGYGQAQPGGWIFNVLGFVEQGQVRSMGSRKSGMPRSEAIVQRCATPIRIFVCPDRRLAKAWPMADPRSVLVTKDENALPITEVARSDYAINTGDFGRGQLVDFIPETLAEGDDPEHQWYDVSQFTGISYGRSMIRHQDVTDGTSSTYLVGEKFLATNDYTTGLHYGDNESMYSGFDNDSGRSAEFEPWQDRWRPPDAGRERFGSAHPAGWNAAFCDGSLKVMSYDIDLEVHKKLGNRADGQVVDLSKL